MPQLPKREAAELVVRRNEEWTEFQRVLRFLGDSIEGGNRYRYADYTVDSITGQGGSGIGNVSSFASSQQLNIGTDGIYQSSDPGIDARDYAECLDRNLIPHKSETGRDGRGTYELRRARTPVPKTMELVVRRHLSRIYAREVKRDGSPDLMNWWDDVDGIGTKIDKYMRKVVAPLLMAYGHLDLCFDHPQPDPDEIPEGMPLTRQDIAEIGLDQCHVSYVLPENMLWWRLNRHRRYAECLVLERHDRHGITFRHWSAADSVLYNKDGEMIGLPVPHPFGCVPIVRLFDERKLRCKNTGQPRYEEVAELQRSIYNSQSEQELGDIYQAHPQVMIPENMLANNGTSLKAGPEASWVMMHDSITGEYAEAKILDYPKGASEDRRQHIMDKDDRVIVAACLTKPSGTATASTSGVVAQSGISKMMDSQTGNDYLAEIAETLGDAEWTMAHFALIVLGDGNVNQADLDSVSVVYPKEFDLFTADDLAAGIGELVALIPAAAMLPETGKQLLSRYIRVIMPGVDDATMKATDREISDMVDQHVEMKDQMREGMANSLNEPDDDDQVLSINQAANAS